ncbi:MAG TPA: DUF302 domain-containing protein [Pyrinomonadaceae bacterium]|mgnify:FL=1|nr:DUF302 domain-containing protein [Chloracidobacterium sp.]HRJ88883.1 DUF302 domain-containing protein [Pyrinomonadaceae bacterium]
MKDIKNEIEKGDYGFRRTVELSFGDAVERIKSALKDEGFGVLTEIDMKAKFKEKLDKDFGEYVMLGACNPGFAFQSLGIEMDLGLLLPCNAVVYERNGKIVIGLIDAEKMLGLTGRSELANMAKEVNSRLERALASV